MEVQKPGFYVSFGGETDISRRNPVSLGTNGRSLLGVQKPGFYVRFAGETEISRRNPVSSSVSGTKGRSQVFKTKHLSTMPSSNIFTAKDVINSLINGINKTRLEEQLIASGWTATPARGGSKSGSGTIWSKETHFPLSP